MEKQEIAAKIKEAKDEIKKEGEIFKEAHQQIPQLSWMLFLKCFDDFEKTNVLKIKNYKGIIPQPLRWRDWATDKSISGDLLIKKVDELFHKFRDLQPEKGKEERNTFATIFRRIPNRIRDGYRLRKLLNFVNEIEFLKPKDIENFSEVYTDQLYEMISSAEHSAYYYTPRPLAKFIATVLEPNFVKKERVFDPACGFGGFLIESLKLMEKYEDSAESRKKLRYETIYGNEKDAETFLCGILNTMVNGISRPNFSLTNTLSKHTREITEKDQFEVIMTNPTYGGEEDKSISKNLPVAYQTSATELHFLFYVMESLKKKGRAAMIVPNGPLFATGVASKIKEKLLSEFNLHTIIRLPGSVFEPYAGIETNILFFDNTGPTKEICYYKMKVSERVKSKAKEPKYSKTKPILYEDFAPVLDWIKHKKDVPNVWCVKSSDIVVKNDKGDNDVNLDQKNPKEKEEKIDLSPHELISQIITDEKKTLSLLEDVEALIKKEIPK